MDAALTQAHARWLQELTDLKEYKVNLKIEQEKWEKEHKETAAKQVAQNTCLCVLINSSVFQIPYISEE